MKAFNINFLIRKSRAKGESSLNLIYCRISMNNVRSEFSIGREIEQERWLVERGKTQGKSNLERELNAHIATITEKFYRIERELLENGLEVTTESLIKRYNNIEAPDETPNTLFVVMDLHNEEMLDLKLKGLIARETYSRYLTTKRYLQQFLKLRYKLDDIKLKSLDTHFVSGFDHWLRINTNCKNNSVVKHVKNLKKIANFSVAHNYLSHNPFQSFRCKNEPVSRGYLTKEELTRLKDLKLDIERLVYVRNLFLLGCYTGLSFTDLVNLKKDNIETDNDGARWIMKARKKTKVMSRIPIITAAQNVLNELMLSPNEKDSLFRSMTNQHVNGYLKELATLAKISKNLSFHVSRHTFATTITLANGVSLESVSAQLGHSNIRQTQHYARMVDSRIFNEMSKLNSMDI